MTVYSFPYIKRRKSRLKWQEKLLLQTGLKMVGLIVFPANTTQWHHEAAFNDYSRLSSNLRGRAKMAGKNGAECKLT